MADTITFKDRDQFAYCRYTGPFALAPLVILAKEVSEYCKSNRFDAALVDIAESRGEIGDFERFKHGDMMSQIFSTNQKIAVLGRKGQVLTDHFWENVTRNRLLKTKVFTDLKKAKSWLQS
jgi:hypothetical protein